MRRFAPTSAGKIAALETDSDLDDYTWRVAGCVGDFWTRLCCAHIFSPREVDEAAMVRDGVRLGKGLQLVNILRDLPQDLAQGRCYMPRQALALAALTPEDLLQPVNEDRFRPLYQIWLERAESHLQAGWNYTNAIPSGQWRLRLACAWPVLLGVRTLALLRRQPMLAGGRPIKIARSQLYGIMARSALFLAFPWVWKSQFEREKSTCK